MLVWGEKESTANGLFYTAEEFAIIKNGTQWQLNYSDFWTIRPEYVFVNIKSQSVGTLKRFAEKAYEKYLEMKNEPEMKIESIYL